MDHEKFKAMEHILVVDDTKSDRNLFKFLLSRCGFHVETAADGFEALELMQRKDFDLVLCDYLMPNLDGYEFLRKVRQEPEFSHVIVIIITSDESDETKAKLLKAGANDFVHKGDSHDEIVARIRVHLSANAAQADRKVLEVICELADQINQPLSTLISTLDVLKEKVQSELSTSQKEDFSLLLNTVHKEADTMMVISEGLKKLIVDAHLHSKFDLR